jgi:hypothetical protein
MGTSKNSSWVFEVSTSYTNTKGMKSAGYWILEYGIIMLRLLSADAGPFPCL